MKKLKKLLIPILAIVLLSSCGGAGGGDYYVKYTDSDAKPVSMSTNNVTYTFVGGVYLNTFSGTEGKSNVVQFKFDGDYTPEEMVGKTIDVMIWETEESLVWSAKDFDEAKTFKCTVTSFDYFKEGMFKDKVYKLTGTFNQDGYKDGTLCLQVDI